MTGRSARPELLLSPPLNGGFAREPNGSNKPLLNKPSYLYSRLLTRPVDPLTCYVHLELLKSADCWEIWIF